MGKNRRIIIITLSAIIVVGIISQLLRPTEPTYQGKRLSQYLEELAARSPYDPQAPPPAIKAIYQMGPKAIPYLQRALREKDSIYVKAMLFLHSHLPSVLASQLPKPDLDHLTVLAAASADCLSYFGSYARPALPDLINCLKDWRLGRAACEAVKEIGPEPENLPALLTLLNSTNTVTPIFASLCIAQIGVTNAALFNSLTKLIQGKDTTLRGCAVHILGQLGDKAAPSIHLLTPLLKDPDRSLRLATAAVLKNIQGKHAISVAWVVHELDQELNHGSPPCDLPGGAGPHEANLFMLSLLLRDFKTEARPATPLLRAIENGPNFMLRLEAARALWEINRETNNLVPLCHEGFKKKEFKIQSGFLLIDFYLDQRITPLELRRMLDRPEFPIQLHAAHALSKLNVQSDKIIPIMIRALEDHFTRDSWFKNQRYLAAETLGQMGPKARPAIPALTLALKDPNEKVRTAAAKAGIK